jgi:hypothetical protein
VRRYGLGIAKPFPIPLTAHLRSRYLKRSRTIGDLARQAGIDAHGLDNTIAAFNVNAREGWDPEFRRGENAYNLYQGDPAHKPTHASPRSSTRRSMR